MYLCFLNCAGIAIHAFDVFFFRCVLELHAIAAKKIADGGKFSLAMTRRERQRFVSSVKNDHDVYRQMLGSVNTETSQCSRPADRDNIHAGIRSSIGFQKLNRMVFEVMTEWMEGELQLAARRQSTGDDHGSLLSRDVLALALNDSGELQDAVLRRENALEVARLSNPENEDQRLTGDFKICWERFWH